MIKRLGGLVLAILMILANQGNAFSAEQSKHLYPGFTPVSESAAYKQYLTRPVSDESKLIFLIDRFSESNIQVVYDGHYFNASAGAKVAKWFMSRRYRNETVKEWIMKWCNTTISGNLIWVKLPNGKFRLSREVLFDEIKALEIESAKSIAGVKKNSVDAVVLAAPISADMTSPATPPIVVPPQAS